ncbi:MAG: multidrug effflux MFS transporter [Chthoniobacteraceae bacterium]
MSQLLIFILAALSMLGALSIDAYLPALPAIGHEFSMSDAAVQQSLTAYVFAFAIMTLFYGTLSDSFGRRPVILGSLVLYLASSIGAAWSDSLTMLIVFRVCQGLSAGAGSVVGRAVVGDLATGAEAHRAMAWMSVVFGLAPAIAPILGGWLQANWGWRSVFWFISTFTFVLMVICIVALPESLEKSKRQHFHPVIILKSYLAVGGHWAFMLRSMAVPFAFVGVMIYVAGASNFVLEILHLKVTQFGWLFLPLIGGMTLGSAVAGKLSHQVEARKLIRWGFGLMAFFMGVNVAYCALLPIQLPWVIIPLFGYAFSMSLIMPAMTVIALELFPEIRGMASSMQTFLFMMLFTVLSGVVAPLIYGHALYFAITSAAGMVLGVGSWKLADLMAEPQPAGEPDAT